jgi:predicted N-acyltransferase
MNEVKIFNSIKEIKKEDWDLLTENNVYMCYEWLKTIEETTAINSLPYYIVVIDEEQIIGASVCYFDQKDDNRIIDRVLLGRFCKLKWIKNITFSPVLICNQQRGHGTHFIFHPKKNGQISQLQDKILEEIERIAKANKTNVCFLNVIRSEKQLMESLVERGYYKTNDIPSNFIDVKWSSFKEYKKYLSLKYPYMNKSIRHQINRNEKAGVKIEQLQEIDDCHDRLIELLKMNHFKYYSSTFPLKSNYFKQLRENFGENAIIYVAKKKGVIIGVSVVLRKGKEAFFSSIGVDHELSQNDLTFFNLGYYEPIKNAAEYNINRIYYGRGLYRTKIKRGCFAEDMSLFYKPQKKFFNSIIKLWFAFHRLWMKNKLSYIKKL